MIDLTGIVKLVGLFMHRKKGPLNNIMTVRLKKEISVISVRFPYQLFYRSEIMLASLIKSKSNRMNGFMLNFILLGTVIPYYYIFTCEGPPKESL